MPASQQRKKQKVFKDHLIQREDILHHHSGSTFTEKEVNIVLLIILAVIAMLFWMPLAEFVH